MSERKLRRFIAGWNPGGARLLPLPLAGEVAPKARVRALSTQGFSIAEVPSPQPSPASGRGGTARKRGNGAQAGEGKARESATRLRMIARTAQLARLMEQCRRLSAVLEPNSIHGLWKRSRGCTKVINKRAIRENYSVRDEAFHRTGARLHFPFAGFCYISISGWLNDFFSQLMLPAHAASSL